MNFIKRLGASVVGLTAAVASIPPLLAAGIGWLFTPSETKYTASNRYDTGFEGDNVTPEHPMWTEPLKAAELMGRVALESVRYALQGPEKKSMSRETTSYTEALADIFNEIYPEKGSKNSRN